MRTWEGGLGIEGDVQDDGQCGMEPQRAYGNLSQRAKVLYSRGQPNTCSRGKGAQRNSCAHLSSVRTSLAKQGTLIAHLSSAHTQKVTRSRSEAHGHKKYGMLWTQGAL